MQIAQLSQAHDMEATKLLQHNCAPFKGQKDYVSRLQKGMKTGLIMGTVQDNAEVKETIERVTERQGMEKLG